MRLVCLSDTHGLQNNFKVPEGDVLIHAGDCCNTGSERDVYQFANWLRSLPHRWKVVIAGNHDWFFQKQPERARAYLGPDVIYLQDSGCEIEGLTFWGSPWQPWFMDWAFNLPRKGAKLREKWNLIPFDTDILITHSPPYRILDQVKPRRTKWGQEEEPGSGPLGCEELAIRLQIVRPKLHVFGHIHDAYGHEEWNGTIYVNASICDEQYRPVNRAVIIDVNVNTSPKVFKLTTQP
jgi:predicted phosphodiesterase